MLIYYNIFAKGRALSTKDNAKISIPSSAEVMMCKERPFRGMQRRFGKEGIAHNMTSRRFHDLD